MPKKTLGLDYTEFGILTKQLQAMDGNIRKTTFAPSKKMLQYDHRLAGQYICSIFLRYSTIILIPPALQSRMRFRPAGHLSL